MEHNNASGNTTNLRQQQQQQQQTREQQLSQKLQDQQHQQQQQTNQNGNQQQFCLRWHNHQTSLLSTLPILLDQSHLTDVTISAEGRTLRAHRVVLSACSSFFLEIFRTLESTHHPVIIIPGASFNAIVSLLTFMYSGEVNVYEEQIPMLLSLAETLGIKGLADVHNNLQKTTKLSTEKDVGETHKEDQEKSSTPPSPQPLLPSSAANFTLPPTPLSTSLNTNLTSSSFNPLLSSSLNSKFTSPLENFFLKSLHFYPNLMHHQPLNFSQTALNKTSELLAKYQQQCNLYQANLGLSSKDLIPSLMHQGTAGAEEESQLTKRFCTGLDKKTSSLTVPPSSNQMTLQQQKDIKRIDKIVENLRGQGATKHDKTFENLSGSPLPSQLHNQLSPLSIKTSMDNYTTNPSTLLTSKSNIFSSPSTTDNTAPLHSQLPFNITPEDQLKLQQHLDKYAQSCARSMEVANENLKNEAARLMTNEKLSNTPTAQTTKQPSNSKLYATCFICHKQLSNQYNLRVHLETHQNVRYACNVCSHVSRSKDALRKHVSYRHPGAPSPCETEARRKRANKVLASQLNAANLALNSPSSGEVTPSSPNTLPHFQSSATTATSSSSNNDLHCAENSGLTAAQLSSAYQMFMPNQFHLAAAAAAQQQQTNEQQLQSTSNPLSNKDFLNTLPSTTPSLLSNTQNSASTEAAKSAVQNNSPLATSTNNNNSNSMSSINPNEITPNSTNTNNVNSVEQRISPNLNT